jgi:hypothetical protein
MTVIEGDPTLPVSKCFLDLAARLWEGTEAEVASVPVAAAG